MWDCFIPDFMFQCFSEVTPEFLAKNNIKYLLIDIDNTLAPYEEPLPSEEVKEWFYRLEKSGVRSVLVSNNHKARVELFNSRLGLKAFYDCRKPSPRRLRLYAESIDAVISETCALGDQIFTDVWGAKKIGARAILVPPIRDKKNLFFRTKRFLEKPFLHMYKRLREAENEKN